MSDYASTLALAPQFTAPMAKVTPLGGQFGPSITVAQARAAAMTPQQRAAAEAKIAATAKDFEAQFVGSMFGEMFEGVEMGGGQGGEAFKSVMMQAIGKKVVAGRGIGLARQVQSEMLKMQGLS